MFRKTNFFSLLLRRSPNLTAATASACVVVYV